MATAAMASAGKRSWPAYRWEAPPRTRTSQGFTRSSKDQQGFTPGGSSTSNGTWVQSKQQLEACSHPRLHTRLQLPQVDHDLVCVLGSALAGYVRCSSMERHPGTVLADRLQIFGQISAKGPCAWPRLPRACIITLTLQQRSLLPDSSHAVRSLAHALGLTSKAKGLSHQGCFSMTYGPGTSCKPVSLTC